MLPASQHSIQLENLVLKQEKPDSSDGHSLDEARQNFMNFANYNQQFLHNQNNMTPSQDNLNSSKSTTTKRRGRPPGSTRKQVLAVKSISEDESLDESSNLNEASHDDSDESIDEIGDRVAKVSYIFPKII